MDGRVGSERLHERVGVGEGAQKVKKKKLAQTSCGDCPGGENPAQGRDAVVLHWCVERGVRVVLLVSTDVWVRIFTGWPGCVFRVSPLRSQKTYRHSYLFEFDSYLFPLQ